ncbi:MAG: hypothetical protein JW841_08885 [Deltaproteobacteria bacterium]|nr:hypothetical protein [Deltaproteobacteria bacterium]
MTTKYFDLDQKMLSEHDIGKSALSDIQLLKNVVAHKKIFFSSSHSKYDDCLNGNFILIPKDTMLDELNKDYKKMINNGMFIHEPPSLDTILKSLKIIEQQINDATCKR